MSELIVRLVLSISQTSFSKCNLVSGFDVDVHTLLLLVVVVT